MCYKMDLGNRSKGNHRAKPIHFWFFMPLINYSELVQMAFNPRETRARRTVKLMDEIY